MLGPVNNLADFFRGAFGAQRQAQTNTPPLRDERIIKTEPQKAKFWGMQRNVFDKKSGKVRHEIKLTKGSHEAVYSVWYDEDKRPFYNRYPPLKATEVRVDIINTPEGDWLMAIEPIEEEEVDVKRRIGVSY